MGFSSWTLTGFCVRACCDFTTWKQSHWFSKSNSIMVLLTTIRWSQKLCTFSNILWDSSVFSSRTSRMQISWDLKSIQFPPPCNSSRKLRKNVCKLLKKRRKKTAFSTKLSVFSLMNNKNQNNIQERSFHSEKESLSITQRINFRCKQFRLNGKRFSTCLNSPRRI